MRCIKFLPMLGLQIAIIILMMMVTNMEMAKPFATPLSAVGSLLAIAVFGWWVAGRFKLIKCDEKI